MDSGGNRLGRVARVASSNMGIPLRNSLLVPRALDTSEPARTADNHRAMRVLRGNSVVRSCVDLFLPAGIELVDLPDVELDVLRLGADADSGSGCHEVS